MVNIEDVTQAAPRASRGGVRAHRNLGSPSLGTAGSLQAGPARQAPPRAVLVARGGALPGLPGPRTRPPPTPPGPRSRARSRERSPTRAFPFVPQAVKLQEQEHREEALRLQRLEERRRLQEAELRRVEEEKERALGLQRRERELRERLLSILLSRKADDPQARDELGAAHADLLQPVLDILQTVSAGCVGAAALHPPGGPPAPGTPKRTPPRPDADGAPRSVNGSAGEGAASGEGAGEDGSAEKRCPGVLACIPINSQQPKAAPAACEQGAPRKDARSEQDKCNREPSGGRGRAGGGRGADDDRPQRERSRPRRAGSREDAGTPRKERRRHRKHARQDDSPARRSASADRDRDHARPRRSRSRERCGRRERSRDRRGGSGRKRSRHRRGDHDRSRSGSPGRHRSAWNR